MVKSTRPALNAQAASRPLALELVVAKVPAQLWLLRNKRTGQWISSYQESATIHRSMLVAASSAEALADAERFYSRYCLTEVEAVRVI